jgi:hypothetical protein
MLAVTPNPLTGALGRRWYIKELTNASAAVFNVLTLAWDATNPSAQQTLINAAPCDMVANNNGATDLYYTLSTGVSAVGATVTNNPPYAVLGSIINGVWITVVQDNNALPVELSSFNCQMSGRDVQLAWETKTEKNSNSFEIERSLTGANTWTNVGSVKAGFTSNVAKQYTYTEKNLQTGKYDYRLKMVDNDGKFEYSKTIEAVITVPKDFDLSQNFPNPFNPSTKINYSLPFDSKVTLDVYNIAGEKVAQIVNEQQPAGYYSVNFSGTSLQKSLSSGIYIYRISAMNTVSGKEFSSIKKMVLLK